MSLDRRSFLQRASLLVPAMHLSSALSMPPEHGWPLHNPRARFSRLALRTATRLDLMTAFYGRTLRLPVHVQEDSLRVTAGETIIEFTKTDSREGFTDPYYHFAFNIPHNQLEAAKAWLEPRCPLVPLGSAGSSEHIIHFQHWDAHAFYFLDPAGNILEFIARHSLKNERDGDLSEKNILCASEIGVVAPEVVNTADQLCEAATLKRYRGGGEDFTAVGDELGLFIVVKTGRRWFSSDRAAEVFRADADVRGVGGALHIRASEFNVKPTE